MPYLLDHQPQIEQSRAEVPYVQGGEELVDERPLRVAIAHGQLRQGLPLAATTSAETEQLLTLGWL